MLRRGGSLLVTTPLGEPGDHGWFRQEDEDGWLRLYASAGLFVEGRRLRAHDRGLACQPLVPGGGRPLRERGPAASAVLCADLRPGRLRRLLTPGGLRTAARRKAGRA